jgi:hypothetical protein
MLIPERRRKRGPSLIKLGPRRGHRWGLQVRPRICLWRFDFGERPKRRAKLFWRLGGEPAIPNGQACHGSLTVFSVIWVCG